MCVECWKKHGSPQIEKDAIKKASNLIRDVYKHSTSGGNLHVQIDDWNIDDEYWKGYENWLEAMGNHIAQEQVDVEKACFEAMKNLSVEERASALALNDGYWFSSCESTCPAPS